MKPVETQPLTQEKRQPWVPPTLKPVGTIGEALQSGGGKISVLTGDPGEPRKVPAHG